MSFLETAGTPHISFRYGGKDSDGLLPEWQTEISTETNARGELTHRTFTDPETSLKVTVHIQRFDDFPAMDWMVEFENCGTMDTPIIENILPMDVSVPISNQERIKLHYANGSGYRMDDFLPREMNLLPRGHNILKPIGGKSSSGIFPFMNLQRQGCGMVIAIGWTGQWMLDFERDAHELRIKSGMERTHLRLHPGEKIRTPRILALLWEGDDEEVGNNLLRQILLAHYSPRIAGELVMPPIAQTLQAYYFLTGKESEQLEMTAYLKTFLLPQPMNPLGAKRLVNTGDWVREPMLVTERSLCIKIMFGAMILSQTARRKAGGSGCSALLMNLHVNV